MKFSVRILIIFTILFISNLYCQNTYFIKYKSSVSQKEINRKINVQKLSDSNVSLAKMNGVKSLNYLAKGLGKSDETLSRILKVTFDDSVPEGSILGMQNSDPSIEYIEKAVVYQLDDLPNDSLVSEQWALKKIQAFDAWNITMGTDTVLLAIIDTGIDYLHLDLKNKIYYNPGENGIDNSGKDKRSNGIDDDNNGFIDDYMGWDFTDRVGFPFDSSGGDYLGWDNDPYDENAHGTYIAGISGAETNNVTGIAGVAPSIKLLNLRAFDPSGYGEEDDVAAAILYAVQAGAKVINMSFGDASFSLVLRDVIRYAYSRNVVLVGSSGNSGSTDPHYPSGYSEVISVGNSNGEDYVAPSSNYGSTLDLVAPGSLILTTARNNSYATISGTSAATPHVSAAAALILSLRNFNNEEVKQIIKSTTDDIDVPGWDLRSGAGRLNLLKALTVVAPSVIKINHPTQDFSTLENELKINATILSPYFINYSLYYGTGFNPDNWNTLIENSRNQFADQDIYTLDISTLPDTVYTLRLEVTLNNGRTSEERVNFYINRTPPDAQLLFVGPSYYGDKATILASMHTDEPSLVRMYFRKTGDTKFNFITLDGFTTNNQFIGQLHYGFIPKQVVQQNTTYEVYFEAENLVGLKTVVKNEGTNFIISTMYEAEYASETELPFSLPPGNILENPLNITTSSLQEIFLREITNPTYSTLFKLNGNIFEKVDSLKERIVKESGDFNNNGLTDLLTYFVYNTFIFEQNSTNSNKFTEKFSTSTGNRWPILADDIDNDNKTELLTLNNDTSIVVWEIMNDLKINTNNPDTLRNFTSVSSGSNIIDSPFGIISDIDNNGTKEFWTVDQDGDIFSYDIYGDHDYRQGSVVNTGFLGSAAYLTAGDYDGDGTKELAVLLHSINELDIAPFYRLIVFNLLGDKFNVLYDQVLIDAATEFNSSFQSSENSIRFADLDNDSSDELILFMFPYSYISKYDSGTNKIISYKENINSNSVFVGDLNLNDVPEVGFPTSQGIKFYEFAVSTIANTPFNVNGYAIDSNSVRLTWDGNANQYYIYRGKNINELDSIATTNTNSYKDSNLDNNTYYFYSIRAYDPVKLNPESDLTLAIKVFVHNPGRILSVKASSENSVAVFFSEKMNNTVENLESFKLNNAEYPNSISPASQYSYLITFKNEIPLGTNQLSMKSLKDLYGSPVPDSTIQFNMDTTITLQKFFISTFNIESPYLIKIVFNKEVDETSALNKENYSFSPENKVTGVTVDDDNPAVIYLNLKGQKPVGSIGKEYVLQMKNIRSSSSSGNIEINDGAGSYIVLTGFAKNLTDVYVYPNPAKIVDASSKITFANLPNSVKITIWTINGTKCGEVEENDGNGGVDFNLRNFNGELLNSGIYIYRAVMIDNSGNEGEEKIGKFAIIK